VALMAMIRLPISTHHHAVYHMAGGLSNQGQLDIIQRMGDVRKVRDIIKIIEADGWYYVNSTGDHHHFLHPTKKGKVTIPGRASADLKPDTWRSVLKQAQIDWRKL
jgi:predicted RNA binding protein YcfA (HicA-like mRNA interferase family)